MDTRDIRVPLAAYALVDRENRLVRLGYTERDFRHIRMDGDRVIRLVPLQGYMEVVPAVRRQRREGERANETATQ